MTPSASIFRATAVWTPDGLRTDTSVEVDETGRIVLVREATSSDPPAADGLLVPGLVNAHTHLELSSVGLVPGGGGLMRWVSDLRSGALGAVDADARLQAAEREAVRLFESGTAAVSDIASDESIAPVIAAAGLQGVSQREVLTLDAKRLQAQLDVVRDCGGEVVGPYGNRVVVRPSPHALYSTAPAIVRACVREPGRAPATMHVAEDRDEMRFVRDGTGPWARFLDALGHDWRWWQPPGGTPFEALDAMGVLGPDLLCVHGVHTSPKDRSLLAKRQAALVLCPSSNVHIGGELPDVAALLASGVRLCLGTDSLASSPDLDVLREVGVLARAFPDVDPQVWLWMATEGGATALKLHHLGAIAVGRSPGLLLLEGVRSPADLVDRVPSRRWLVRPGSSGGSGVSPALGPQGVV